jgi:hypothetical protein
MFDSNSSSANAGKPANKISPLGYPSELLVPQATMESVMVTIGSIVLNPKQRQPIQWYIAAAIAFSLLLMFFGAIGRLIHKGVGIWGINIPIARGFAIVNFVWWVYYSVQILLLGAASTRIYASKFGSHIKPPENADFVVKKGRHKTHSSRHNKTVARSTKVVKGASTLRSRRLINSAFSNFLSSVPRVGAERNLD